jgi:transcriptional regulator with XRE-family HTH domain
MTEPTAGAYSRAAGKILWRARKDAGLSLAQAAAKSGGLFTAVALRSYEAGERKLSLDKAVDLAHFYGIPPARLLPREPEPEIDEAAVAALALILANANVGKKIARLLVTGGCVPPGTTPVDLEPGEPLILTDGEVNMLGTIVDELRARIRDRDSITTDGEPDGTP